MNYNPTKIPSKILIICLLLVASDSAFAQEKTVMDWDGDGVQDSVYMENARIVCRLSTEQFEKHTSKEIEFLTDNFGIRPGDDGFEFFIDWMRAGYSNYFSYNCKEKRMQLVFMSRYEFGNACNDGSGESYVDLLNGSYTGDWSYYDEDADELIGMPTIKTKMPYGPLYLEDFSEETYFDYARRCADLFYESKHACQRTRKLLEKQLDNGRSWGNDVTDVPDGYTYTKEDLEVTSELIHEELAERGFRTDSILFRHRVKELFGISLDTVSLQITSLGSGGYGASSDIELEMFQHEVYPTIFLLSAKNNIMVYPYYIPEIIDYKSVYPDIARMEDTVSTSRNSEFGDEESGKITVFKFSNYEDELKAQRQDNITNLFHVNNYLIYNQKASLTWLVANEYKFLFDLLTVFGYDKEDRINRLVLDRIPKVSDNAYDGSSFDGILAAKDHNGRLNIRENLLKYMRENANGDYATMLSEYGLYCIGENGKIEGNLFTKAERLKIAAYMLYYLRLIYLDDCNRSDTNRQPYVLNDRLFTMVGALIDENGTPWAYEGESSRGGDSECLTAILKNNYYGLPNFKEMLDRIIDDARIDHQPAGSD